VPKSTRRRFRLTTKRKRALAWVALLVAFVAALTAWSGGTDHPAIDVPLAHPATDTATSPTSTPTTLPPRRPTGVHTGKSGGPTNILTLVPNLSESKNVNPADLPARQVVMTVTSDRPILRVGYRVLYGHPDESSAINVTSPMQITTVGRGYGLVAAIGAQATPIATYITCTVSVDGHLHSQHTVRGGYSVVACLG
jgi:hypothetical protein